MVLNFDLLIFDSYKFNANKKISNIASVNKSGYCQNVGNFTGLHLVT